MKTGKEGVRHYIPSKSFASCDISEFILWVRACDTELAKAVGVMEKMLPRR